MSVPFKTAIKLVHEGKIYSFAIERDAPMLVERLLNTGCLRALTLAEYAVCDVNHPQPAHELQKIFPKRKSYIQSYCVRWQILGHLLKFDWQDILECLKNELIMDDKTLEAFRKHATAIFDIKEGKFTRCEIAHYQASGTQAANQIIYYSHEKNQYDLDQRKEMLENVNT